MTPRRRRIVTVLLVVLAFVALVGGVLGYRDGRSGRHVAASRMLQHDRDFDFSAPPCAAANRPAEADVRVAYLGVGAVLIEWRGAALATAPYWTRQGPLEVLFGNLRSDIAKISREATAYDAANWSTVLSGHAHYDHLADVPELLLHHAKDADVWTNRSGQRMLNPFPTLDRRVHAVDDVLGSWIRPLDGEGIPLPYRFAPIESEHAPHLYGTRFSHGEVTEEWDSWKNRRVSSMRDGITVAYLVDLLDEEDRTAFRLYLLDAAAPSGMGHPPRDWIEEHAVDLAVLCTTPHWHTSGYPEELLAATGASYVLAAHYENFLQPLDRPVRFINSLTDARMDAFLEIVERGTDQRPVLDLSQETCGPRGERWIVPLPGEWVGFDLTPQ